MLLCILWCWVPHLRTIRHRCLEAAAEQNKNKEVICGVSPSFVIFILWGTAKEINKKYLFYLLYLKPKRRNHTLFDVNVIFKET